MQKYDDQYFPVMYISKKLLDRERNYSVIERECLRSYRSICMVETRELVLQIDHEPLSYLNQARLSNPRVMRWAITLQPYRFRVEVIKGQDNLSTLQPYRFRVEVIKGQDNLSADFLSRVI